jgi:hypothetical protein
MMMAITIVQQASLRKAAVFWGQLTKGCYTPGMDHIQQDKCQSQSISKEEAALSQALPRTS